MQHNKYETCSSYAALNIINCLYIILLIASEMLQKTRQSVLQGGRADCVAEAANNLRSIARPCSLLRWRGRDFGTNIYVCQSLAGRSLTCFSSRSLLADRHVTRYLVRFRNEPNTSSVRWSRDERCSMNEMTRKPRFWIMCCCTVWLLSTSSHMKPSSLELRKRRTENILLKQKH